MTTGSGGPSADAAWRTGWDRSIAKRLGVVAGCVTLAAVTRVSALLLDNLYGPLGGSESAGTFAALGCAVVAAMAMFWVTRWMARRSRALLVVALAVATAAGWVLLPRQIDVTESWVPQPNERYSCTGWAFRHYPPGTFDADATTYCIGLEHRIADG